MKYVRTSIAWIIRFVAVVAITLGLQPDFESRIYSFSSVIYRAGVFVIVGVILIIIADLCSPLFREGEVEN